jgi:hypothetical protein
VAVAFADGRELERMVAHLEKLVVLLATAPHLCHLVPPVVRAASLVAGLPTEDLGD